MPDSLTEKKILTVTELNRTVKRLLETHFHVLWIEGEISNLSRPTSGHLYFSLKDEQAQVRCALFRLRNVTLPFEPQNGMHILAAAKISLYEGRGDYQLIIEHLEERGEGALRRRFEVLKNKLASEGLFDSIYKKSLPLHPKCIGVVTSPTGAAIRDVISVLKRRFANIPVVIYPASVQGEQAAAQITNAIALANQRNECDVLIICRGGGSLEDLFAFNDEVVARAIFNSKLPTVTGIGHEVDFTIADFVADQRAPTPSAAAEFLSPEKKEYAQRLLEFIARISHLTRSELRHKRLHLENFQRRFLQPGALLQQHSQTIDLLEQTLKKTLAQQLENKSRLLKIALLKLNHLSPTRRLKEHKLALQNKTQILMRSISHTLSSATLNLQAAVRLLNSVSPLNTLERGYSIVSKNNHIVGDIAKIKPADKLTIEIKSGFIFCNVEETKIKEAKSRDNEGTKSSLSQ
ncbi:MAG: exodeoxyribonuclease VII large subunit [Gammaproteobacteria bacterium]|nr:exodeoxyribonuclease VII large subunit [Gammaproteobacteria bacterium]